MLSGCTPVGSGEQLKGEVAARLEQGFKPGLFDVKTLKRAGSAPLADGADGHKRRVVCFNATLGLKSAYDTGAWDGLSPGTLAAVLGATEKGIAGLKAGVNPAGGEVRAHGTVTFEQAGDEWKPAAYVPPRGTPAPGGDDAVPRTRSQELIDQLAAKVNTTPGLRARDDASIAAELEHALRSITSRLDRNKEVFVIAGGPEGGAYARLASALVLHFGKSPRTSVIDTDGSVENLLRIGAGEAQLAFAQSDLAASALTGEGAFAAGGPIRNLRALGSLFPEPVHVIVSARSPLSRIADFKGKRVELGLPASGTRQNAVEVLRAHGVELGQLAAVEGNPLATALANLRNGRVDAVFATIAAPANDIQRAAGEGGIRLLSLDPAAIAGLTGTRPGLVPLAVAANTCRGQSAIVHTVAATALLVVSADADMEAASAVLKLVYDNTNALTAESAQAARISRRTGLVGITLPLHPAAERFFGGAAATPDAGRAAAPPK